MKLKGKNVLVYGMGVSGQEACKLLHEHGACVSIYDDDKRFVNLFNFQKNPLIKKYDLIVVSPGVKVLGNNLISHFLMNKIKIISELDLGCLFNQGHIIGITGTNGKTTVTSLIGHIFKSAGKDTYVCGNIGLPLSSVVEKTNKNSFVICEVSNFQLELSSKFSPECAVVLNIAPDHIDRHGSYEEYINTKKKIISKKHRQKVVLNFDDKIVNLWKNDKKTTFFSKKMLNKGVFIKNNAIYHNRNKIISLSDIPLFGEKNIENIMASIAVCCKYKIKNSIIRSAILSYKLPPHRLEYIGNVNGAEVFDDSKATNISSALSAIESLGEKGLVLLIGGLNKDCEFDEIFNKNFNFEKVICFGLSANIICECAKKYGYEPIVFESMKNATFFAKQNAEKGQKILLAPACSSFDEFASYNHRGEVFKEIMLGTFDKLDFS